MTSITSVGSVFGNVLLHGNRKKIIKIIQTNNIETIFSNRNLNENQVFCCRFEADTLICSTNVFTNHAKNKQFSSKKIVLIYLGEIGIHHGSGGANSFAPTEATKQIAIASEPNLKQICVN
jgi:hypothetical protein